jgi:hypothetical protein
VHYMRNLFIIIIMEACGSAVGWSTILQAGRSWVPILMTLHISNPRTSLCSAIYSACNRNEYQKKKKECFWGVEHCRHIRLTTSLPSVG